MRILFFSQARLAAGQGEVEWILDKPLSVQAFWERLIAQFPQLAPYRAMTRLARNGQYVTSDTCFENSDEIALIPPVSGG